MPDADELTPEQAAPSTTPSLFGVFAHPDDESLLAGGVLAQHAAAHARTGVVTMTWAPDSPRAAELADALQALGASAPRMLGYGDARNPHAAPGRPRLLDAPLDDVVAALVQQIRSFRPDLVVTHDALGQLTGHPDHRRTHQAALLAVQDAGLPHLHPEAGAPWQPRAVYCATHPESGVGELGPLLKAVGKAVLAVPDAYVTTTVDVTPWLEQKWAAILAHRGEVARERPLPGVLARLPEESRRGIIATEYFTRLATAPRWCGAPRQGPSWSQALGTLQADCAPHAQWGAEP
ncbi:PIG-L deacetylase family protein [Streptomyces longwoodensis]|uniref:PIG-L deacetylase family protein n=1 Tax=Streptomyces longwoodensis TaxID=68231 RepID=UPI0033EBEDE1